MIDIIFYVLQLLVALIVGLIWGGAYVYLKNRATLKEARETIVTQADFHRALRIIKRANGIAHVQPEKKEHQHTQDKKGKLRFKPRKAR